MNTPHSFVGSTLQAHAVCGSLVLSAVSSCCDFLDASLIALCILYIIPKTMVLFLGMTSKLMGLPVPLTQIVLLYGLP